jgi:PhnB protein
MTVKPIPDGHHTVTPYLIVGGAEEAIAFYKRAFGAEELMRMEMPGGKVGHAEIKIGDSPIMLADEYPDMGFVGPRSLGGTPVSVCVYVEDCDAIFNRAIEAGATEMKPVQDMYYGDRMGTLVDPFGHVWTIGTHKEDVSVEELRRRHEEATNGGA